MNPVRLSEFRCEQCATKIGYSNGKQIRFYRDILQDDSVWKLIPDPSLVFHTHEVIPDPYRDVTTTNNYNTTSYTYYDTDGSLTT